MATPTRRANGEGSRPVQRQDGRWQILIRHTDADGVRKRATVTGKTAKETRQKAEEVRARLKKELPPRDTRQLVDQYAETWIKTTLANSDRKTSTKTMYAAVARHHIIGSQLGATPMHRVRPSAVDGWLAELRRKGLSDSTRRNAYTILRAVFDAAVKDRELADNPVAAVPRPRVEVKEAEYLTPEQVKLLLAAARDTRYGLLFEFLVNTGLRRGEALALKWRSHVKEEDGWLKIRGTLTREDGELVITSTKTAKSRREVPITDRTAAILQQLRARQVAERDRAGSQWNETGYVFTTAFGEPCDPRNALRALKVAAEQASLPSIGLHTLRHSAASTMLANGVPLKVVSEILGHSSISITGDIYGHVSPDISVSAMQVLSDALQ